MTNIHPAFVSFANTATLPTTVQPPQKTEKELKNEVKNEEVKALLQSPNDPLAKYPLRGFGYANEVGAAVSAMPGWGKTAELLLWAPALLYLGADIFDKYSRGKEGNYSQASVNKAVEQATFQALASVILPTAAVKMGQNLAGIAAKYDGSKLTANVQEEIFRKLGEDFDKAKFAKGDITVDGNIRKGIDRITDKVFNSEYENYLTTTKSNLQKEGKAKKVFNFIFGHTSEPVNTSKADRETVKAFIKNKIGETYELQTKLESIVDDNVSSLEKPIQKLYQKALKKIDKYTEKLLSENQSYFVKKLLNSNDANLAGFRNELMGKYPLREQIKLFASDKNACAEWLNETMKNPESKKSLTSFARKIEISRNVVSKYIKGKEMRMGFMKTAGGFIALACLAVPIDHFVHKYIIKKAVAPALDNVSKLNQNFKGNKTDKK